MTTSYITTFRDSGPYRLTNLLTVLHWLRGFDLDQIIVVEQDQQSTLDEDLLPSNVQPVFCFNPGPFNRAWGMNVAARLAESDVLIVSDADMIMDQQTLGLAAAACHGQHGAINPYRRMRDLSESETRALVDRTMTIDQLPQQDSNTRNRTGIGEFVSFCGGIFVIQRALYFDIGGMDERFSGWGGEDDAMSHKLLKLYPNARELDRSMAFHLWHPRDTAQCYGHKDYHNNLALLRTYHVADVDELRKLADTTRSNIGNRARYMNTDSGTQV